MANEIAIIGMAGRFPGATNLDEYYQNLRNGVEAITFFNEAELRARGVAPETLADPHYVKACPILAEADAFDADFFQYSVREATLLDPQQRCFLECAWAALENAGYSAQSYAYPIGVFAGTSTNTYLLDNIINKGMAVDLDFMKFISAYISGDKDFVATRVSYKLNLTGPSFTVQTACSTSLVAVHTACQNLLNGECDLALAGAVTIRFPTEGYTYKPDGMVSPDGHCRAFDAKAQGTLFGSGLGVVVLKRLADAQADGDHILAVIKGSALNNDGGAKLSYTAPSLDQQSRVVADALSIAEVEPETIGYLEAHGTGTPLGDPVEVAALSQVYREYTDQQQFCAIGSVKTNIGHLDVAAGMAGLIKVILTLQHRELFPSLHFTAPNPQIDFANSPFYVNTRRREFTAAETPRRAAITSLGVGGTNAHIILEEAPPSSGSEPTTRSHHLLLLSAKTSTALAAAAENLRTFFQANPNVELADVAYTLQLGRIHFPYKRAIICRNVAEAIVLLQQPDQASDQPAALAEVQNATSLPAFAQVAANDLGRFLYRLAALWKMDASIDWQALYAGEQRQRVPLPTYPFERKPYRFEGSKQPAPNQALPSQTTPRLAPVHPLLHNRIHSPQLQNSLFESEFSLQTLAYLDDHRVYGLPIVPAACHIAMTLAAALEQTGATPKTLENIVFAQALFLPETGARTVQLILNQSATGQSNYQLVSCPAGQEKETDAWVAHSSGAIVTTPPSAQKPQTIREIQARCAEVVAREQFYSHGRQIGFEWEGNFQAIQQIWRRDGEALALIEHSAPLFDEAAAYPIHPAILDACLQPYLASFASGGPHASTGDAYIPLSIGHLHYYGKPTRRLWSHVVWHSAPHIHNNGQTNGYVGNHTPHRQVNDHHAMSQNSDSLVVDIALLDESGELFCQINCLHLVRVSSETLHQAARRQSPQQDDFIYQPIWKSAPLNLAPPQVAKGAVVIVQMQDDPSPLADWLAAAHPRQTVLHVRLGAAYRVAGGEIEINHKGQADFDRLMDELPVFDLLYFLGGVSCHRQPNETELDYLNRSQEAGLLSLFRLLKSLIQQNRQQPFALKVITQGVQAVAEDEQPYNPYAGSLIGLAKVIARENRQIAVSCLDIDAADLALSSAQAEARSRLIQMIVAEPGQVDVVEVALRAGQRFVKRLVKTDTPLSQAGQTSLKPAGVYMILGGGQGVGLAIGHYLAQHYQARLVLVGRSPLDAQRQAALAQIAAVGGQAIYVAQDITSVTGVQQALAAAKTAFGSVQGIIHSAAVLHDGVLMNLDEAAFVKVLAPKVQGTVALYEAVKGETLDFIAFFSSENSFRGNAGQSNYVAACTFQDAYARYLHLHHRLPVKVINWGYWGNVGMASSAEFKQIMARHGLQPITTPEGGALFAQIIHSPFHQLAPIKCTERLFAALGIEQAEQSERLKSRPEQANGFPSQGSPAANGHFNLHSLEQLPLADRRVQLGDYLKQSVIDTLQVGEAATLDMQAPLSTLGMDSLIAIDFCNALSKSVGKYLPTTLIFDYPTLNAIADYLVQDILGWTESDLPASAMNGHSGRATYTLPAPSAVAPLDNLDDLSVAELEALLLEELGVGSRE